MMSLANKAKNSFLGLQIHNWYHFLVQRLLPLIPTRRLKSICKQGIVYMYAIICNRAANLDSRHGLRSKMYAYQVQDDEVLKTGQLFYDLCNLS